MLDSTTMQDKGKHKGKDPKASELKPKESQKSSEGASGTEKNIFFLITMSLLYEGFSSWKNIAWRSGSTSFPPSLKWTTLFFQMEQIILMLDYREKMMSYAMPWRHFLLIPKRTWLILNNTTTWFLSRNPSPLLLYQNALEFTWEMTPKFQQ